MTTQNTGHWGWAPTPWLRWPTAQAGCGHVALAASALPLLPTGPTVQDFKLHYTRIVPIFTYNMVTFQQAYFPLYIPHPKLDTLHGSGKGDFKPDNQ